MKTPPSRHRIAGRLLLGVALAVAILLLLWLAAGPGGRDGARPVVRGPLPPVEALPRSPAVPVAEDGEEPSEAAVTEVPSTSLHIWLKPLDETRWVWSVPDHPFDGVWPDDDDPRWDHALLADLESPEAIRSLSGPGTPFKGRRGRRVLDVAVAEGFGPDALLDTPEAALLGLYTAWMEGEVRYEEDWDAFEARHLPDGLRRNELPPDEVRALYRRPDAPTQDLSALEATAAYVASRWPDHPVAEHAKLARMRAARPYGSYEEWDLGSLADQLASIDEPVIREHAALSLTGIREPGERLLDLVFDVEATRPIDRLRLATWGMARAVGAEDWERAAAWSERVRAALEPVCDEDRAITDSGCEYGSYQLRETVARLVALGIQQPHTWQEALTAEAWRCHLDTPADLGISRTNATWTGDRWQLEPWQRDTAVTGCLDTIDRTEVVPDAPVQVALTLEVTD